MPQVNEVKSLLVKWRECLSGPDEHSIVTQIGNILWRTAFYRSLNESRRFLPDDSDGGKQANRPLHQMIDEGYIIMNAMAIRRLLDKGEMSGKKGVYSLYGLICEITANIAMLTRENILASRDLTYDFEPIKRAALDKAWRSHPPGTGKAHFVSKEGWGEAEYWHGVMDELSEVRPDNRNSQDFPNRKKMDQLLQGLDAMGKNIQEWVNKFVAHAAVPESRQQLPPDDQTMTLAKLWRAERIVLRVANFISRVFIDGTNIANVPMPQFDPYKFLDRPVIEPGAIARMQQVWDHYSEEIEATENWSWDGPLVDTSDGWNDEPPPRELPI